MGPVLLPVPLVASIDEGAKLDTGSVLDWLAEGNVLDTGSVVDWEVDGTALEIDAVIS